MVSSGPGMMMIEGTLLYMNCAQSKVFNIYDVSDLSSVTLKGSLGTGSYEPIGSPVKIGNYVYTTSYIWQVGSYMHVINVSDPTNPVMAGNVLPFTGYLRKRNDILFSFDTNTPTISSYSLTDPLNPVVEDSLTVAVPAPSSSLSISHLSYPMANWVGNNYLVGMTHGSAAQYHGPRALNFTVN